MKKVQHNSVIRKKSSIILHLTALVLALAITVGFAGCAAPEQTQQESMSQTTESEPDKEQSQPGQPTLTLILTPTPVRTPESTPEPVLEPTPYHPANVPCSYGVFTLKNRTGQYLNCFEDNLCLSDQAYNWYFRPAGQEDGWHIVKDSLRLKMLDIDNARYNNGNKVKLWEDTGNTAQHWQFEEYAPGEYIIVSAEEPKYVLASNDRGFFITRRKAIGDRDVWTVQLQNMAKLPIEVKGGRGIVTIILEQRILKVISMDRLQKWADDLENAYDSYAELTGYAKYDTVLVQANEHQKYWGFYSPGTNEICIDSKSMYEDLSKMAAREPGDWNFGVLHEMGHLFDDGHSWDFNCEVMTDIKLFYVMDINSICATPSEYSSNTSFRGLEVLKAARELGGRLEDGYGVWEMIAKLTEIAQEIGWDSFKTVFREFPELKEGTTDAKKLKVFLDLLTDASGRDVRAMFTPKEWAAVTAAYPMK
ncbi:MAG: hypothetical protein BWY11_01058 [Firmicutes bacterium ADurb.Bin182]|nr:MAG: hypothetical protein BWY11_01058 [Firmicutes bacterium ADurb.Bin182]